MLRGLSLSSNIILNTSCKLPSVLLCLLCLLATPTFVRPLSLCPLVLRNTRMQVSQGHSTYTEAKSSTPLHLLHLSSTTLHTYLCSCWSSLEELVLTVAQSAASSSLPHAPEVARTPAASSLPALAPAKACTCSFRVMSSSQQSLPTTIPLLILTWRNRTTHRHDGLPKGAPSWGDEIAK